MSDNDIDVEVNVDALALIANAANNVQDATEVDEETASFWDVFKSISSISIPTALSYTYSFEVFLIIVLFNYLNESEEEIAASTLITLLMNIFIVTGMSPLFAMNVKASHKIGELEAAEKQGRNEEELAPMREYIAGINRNGLILSALLTPPTVAGLVFSKPLLELFGQNEQVSQLTQDFLRIYSPAVPALFTRISTEQLLLAFKRSKEAMFIGLANLSIGTGLALWLGGGGLGIQPMGTNGIAVAYVIEAYLTSIAYALYLARHKDFAKFDFFKVYKRFEGQLKQFGEILKVGGSISITLVSELATSLSLGIFSGLLGPQQQSAMSYINQYVALNFLGVAAFGQTSSQELNRQIGQKKYENASRFGKYGLLTTLMYTTPIPLFFAIAPQYLIISSSDQSELEATLKTLAPIISAATIIDAARFNILQQSRSLTDLKIPTLISVSALSTGIGLSAILGLETPMGINGVALGYLIGEILATTPLVYRWWNRVGSSEIEAMANKPSSTQNANSLSILGLFNRCRKGREDEKITLLEATPQPM